MRGQPGIFLEGLEIPAPEAAVILARHQHRWASRRLGPKAAALENAAQPTAGSAGALDRFGLATLREPPGGQLPGRVARGQPAAVRREFDRINRRFAGFEPGGLLGMIDRDRGGEDVARVRSGNQASTLPSGPSFSDEIGPASGPESRTTLPPGNSITFTTPASLPTAAQRPSGSRSKAVGRSPGDGDRGSGVAPRVRSEGVKQPAFLDDHERPPVRPDSVF